MVVLRRVILSRSAAILAIPVILLTVSSVRYPLTLTAIDPVSGEQTFRQRCSGCHSLERDSRSTMGPGLHDVGAVAKTRRPGLSAARYLHESIVDPDAFRAPGQPGAMPANVARDLDGASIRNLVAYLMKQGGRPDYREILGLSADGREASPRDQREFSLASVEAGKRIFTGGGECSSCHPLSQYPGYDRVAPSLLGVGSIYAAEELERAILDPSSTIRRGYEQTTVITISGETHYGRVMRAWGDKVCVLVDRRPRWFPRSEIAELVASATSQMPSYRGVLRDDELRDVIAFLETLRAPMR